MVSVFQLPFIITNRLPDKWFIDILLTWLGQKVRMLQKHKEGKQFR